ncbi:H+-glucitol symporter [Clostridium beijerinckii]|uniref:H+-glucitol symporter n=1 Tax=Clostridium beijerinckii TaxID=1520 RepID=A0A0B5QN29_CLOBE|nr:glycoside-pentoside-hexuronide (GPH):cation symporter [Clostridium beijerinckii]AJG98208.1 H+-glucitol symporter [Clostridium beijerinckii]
MNVTENVRDANVFLGEDKKLKFIEKLLLSINGGTGVFHNQMIQIFLLFYYSDVLKINMAYVGTLFLVVRIFDAIGAPAFGAFIDRISTPWGKYKPWYIAIGVLDGLFGWLTFTNFDLSPTGKIIYATITYFIYSTIKAFAQGPGQALVPAVTKRVDDRISMYKIGGFLVPISALLVVAGVAPLYKIIGGGDAARGFSFIMAGIFVISALIAICQAFVIKERYIVEPSENKKENKVTFKDIKSTITNNKTALIVYINGFVGNLANGIRSGATIYFFKYYFHNEALMAVSGVTMVIPTIFGLMLSGILVKRIGLRNSIILGIVPNALLSFGAVFIPPTQIGATIYIGCGLLGGFIGGLTGPAIGTMMPAAIDYAEWKTGKNMGGLMGSVNGLLATLSTAISGAAFAFALPLIGYVGGAAEQSASTITWLKMLMTLIPSVICLPSLYAFWFDLTENKQAEISKDLAERRSKAVESETV